MASEFNTLITHVARDPRSRIASSFNDLKAASQREGIAASSSSGAPFAIASDRPAPRLIGSSLAARFSLKFLNAFRSKPVGPAMRLPR